MTGLLTHVDDDDDLQLIPSDHILDCGPQLYLLVILLIYISAVSV